MFIAALFTIAKKHEQPKCPSTEEQIKKVWQNLPGRSVVENAPADAGGMLSAPSLGGSHVLSGS